MIIKKTPNPFILQLTTPFSMVLVYEEKQEAQSVFEEQLMQPLMQLEQAEPCVEVATMKYPVLQALHTWLVLQDWQPTEQALHVLMER